MKGKQTMKQYPLTEEEKKQISHLIAQRSLSTIGGLESDRAIKQYLEYYNHTRNKLDDYNKSIK